MKKVVFCVDEVLDADVHERSRNTLTAGSQAPAAQQYEARLLHFNAQTKFKAKNLLSLLIRVFSCFRQLGNHIAVKISIGDLACLPCLNPSVPK